MFLIQREKKRNQFNHQKLGESKWKFIMTKKCETDKGEKCSQNKRKEKVKLEKVKKKLQIDWWLKTSENCGNRKRRGNEWIS